MQKETTALKLNSIIKYYGSGENKVQALKGVDLGFRKKEFVSILGPSGCGKTTLLNIIGGLDRYSSGDLIIEGKSTKNYTDKDWDAYRNNSIGFVFQSYNLIPHQTVLGNVELALQLSGIKREERRARAIKMLEKVGLKDQMQKKPNQLSGGQMQRVAIARALINDPEIILADEPTGALDTETSIQIMDILKEVSKTKLVIMVTHNPELAEKYSTRIIRLLDGNVVGDTNPFTETLNETPRANRKPKMGFKTALSLSLKNLFSKKARTILTSIAGSIGIIGVALVLAVSNGFSIYMERMQTDTLSSYPITISETEIDLSSFTDMYENDVKVKYPKLDNVGVKKAFEKLTGMLKSNDELKNKADDGFLTYLNNINEDYIYTISYDYGFDMNDYLFTTVNYSDKEFKHNNVFGNLDGEHFWSIQTLISNIEDKYNSELSNIFASGASGIAQYIPTTQVMPDSAELLKSQYDILKSKEGVSFESVLKSENQVFLVVDEYNEISDISLALLGFLGVQVTGEESNFDVTFSNSEGITYDEVIGKELYFATNNVVYDKNANFAIRDNYEDLKSQMTKLEIVGIIRPKENSAGVLKTGFAYSPKLYEKAITDNEESEIFEAFKFSPYVLINNKFKSLRSFAGVDTPSKVSIYPKDFESKEKVKDYIDAWNDSHEEEEDKQITYSDMMSLMFSALTTMVDAVTIVLVAFSSISLIVSSVMIGIITYVSVVERTKEIGVLRSLGASKREISRVFNAETFLIGLFAGLIGVLVTVILCIPINIIVNSQISGIGTLALLNPLTALILIVISFALTMISGLIPARIASKKDPVVALRTE